MERFKNLEHIEKVRPSIGHNLLPFCSSFNKTNLDINIKEKNLLILKRRPKTTCIWFDGTSYKFEWLIFCHGHSLSPYKPKKHLRIKNILMEITCVETKFLKSKTACKYPE